MEEDIQNYLPTVMFRGTPCMLIYSLYIYFKFIMHIYLEFKGYKISTLFIFLRYFVEEQGFCEAELGKFNDTKVVLKLWILKFKKYFKFCIFNYVFCFLILYVGFCILNFVFGILFLEFGIWNLKFEI